MVALRTRIVRIGNSQGVRIPKPLLEQAGIGDHVELEVVEGQIAIRPARTVRAGWADQFEAMNEAGDDALIDGVGGSRWDAEEWEW